jgi:Integrase core domain
MGVSLPPLACVSLIQAGNDQCPPGQADRHDDAAPGGHGQRVASVKFLIRDRAGQFTGSFDAVFTAEGIRILRSPPQAPRPNAICERMIGTLRRELLDRLLIVDEHHLHRVLTEYLRHYNAARPHRALGQLTPAQADTQPPNRSTSPSTGSAEPKSSVGSPTSTMSPPYNPTLLRKGAGHSPESYFRDPHGAGRADRP